MMTIKAPRPGTLIYKSNWRGEKTKVGDSTWRGNAAVEIVSLDKMYARGDVDEIQAATVAVGLSVVISLESHPDKEYRGRIRKLHDTVRRESYQSKRKVMPVEVALDESDRLRMRPGMRFRGRIETARLQKVLKVPLDAVWNEGGQAFVLRKEAGGATPVPVKLGERTREHVRVLHGLSEGALVARFASKGGPS